MTERTTDQWAALLDGTTPGPWKFEEHDVWEHTAGLACPAVQVELEHSVQGENGNHLFGAFNNYTMIEHPGNLPLAAAAPEAVAEVIRLRKELEGRIRVWLIVADKLDNRGLAAEADVTRTHANELTSILNGDTNE